MSDTQAISIEVNGTRYERSIEPRTLLSDFLRHELSPHMVPRYLRVVEDFPRTPTQKIEKYKLRAQGVTRDTWDREAAGIAVRGDRLERRG